MAIGITAGFARKSPLRLCAAVWLCAATAQAEPLPASESRRFGDWVITRTPAAPPQIHLHRRDPGSGAQAETAVLLQLDAHDASRDFAALRRGRGDGLRLRECRTVSSARVRVPRLDQVSTADGPDTLPEFPDDAVQILRTAAGERSLRRYGDELVADLGSYRLKVAADSNVVRVGDPHSGDFCRYEAEADDEDPFFR